MLQASETINSFRMTETIVNRFSLSLDHKKIHLAIEGSCGGTSLGLHFAAQIIGQQHRVLWAGAELPHPQRFSQLFSHIPLTESSKFHAMSFGVKFDRTINEIILAAHSLPGVALIVLDDWCPSTGHIESERIEGLSMLAEKIPSNICILAISKGSEDVSGSRQGKFHGRAEKKLMSNGYEVATLTKSKDGYARVLSIENNEYLLNIQDEGFSLISE